jgi:hypothetical protein
MPGTTCQWQEGYLGADTRAQLQRLAAALKTR